MVMLLADYGTRAPAERGATYIRYEKVRAAGAKNIRWRRHTCLRRAHAYPRCCRLCLLISTSMRSMLAAATYYAIIAGNKYLNRNTCLFLTKHAFAFPTAYHSAYSFPNNNKDVAALLPCHCHREALFLFHFLFGVLCCQPAMLPACH